jgi:hypothetical protein
MTQLAAQVREGRRERDMEGRVRPALVWLESMRLTRHWNLLTAGAASSSCALYKRIIKTSVGDPQDPHVFGPPGSGSGSTRQMYGSESFPFS